MTTWPPLSGGGTPHPQPPRIGSLFTGYGGLDMAVRGVLGGELAWVSDIDPGANALLAHRHPDVPNLGDVSAVDWSEVAPVDVLAGGFPCTDVSLAGQMAGLKEGTRSGLWIQMARAVREVRPRIVVIENVRGLCSAPAHSDLEPCPWCVGDDDGIPLRALGAVLGDLADLGYDARWCGLRAADVGAPHGRYRVFIVAFPSVARGVAPNPAGDGRDEGWTEPARVERGPDAAVGGAVAAAHPDCVGRERPGTARDGGTRPAHDGEPPSDADADGAGREGAEPARGRDVPARGAAADPAGSRRGRAGSVPPGTPEGTPAEAVGTVGRGGGAPAVTWGAYEPAIRRWEHVLGRPAPAPTVPGRNGPVLSPHFVEWLMGLPEGWVCDVPGLTRNQMLRLLGNGVVPQQGAAAIAYLFARSTAAAAA